jgi:hypothetical protein
VSDAGFYQAAKVPNLDHFGHELRNENRCRTTRRGRYLLAPGAYLSTTMPLANGVASSSSKQGDRVPVVLVVHVGLRPHRRVDDALEADEGPLDQLPHW